MMHRSILTAALVLSTCTATAQERLWQFAGVATIDGQVVSYPGDRWNQHGSQFLAPLTPVPRPIWQAYASMLSDGVEIRVQFDTSQIPGFTRTVFVPFPEVWEEPATETSGPWTWPEVTIFDEVVMGTHYRAVLESFGLYPTVNYMSQPALDRILVNWGGTVDDEIIDQGDLDRVLGNWGRVVRPEPEEQLVPAVPEPEAWVIGIATAAVMLIGVPLRRVFYRFFRVG